MAHFSESKDELDVNKVGIPGVCRNDEFWYVKLGDDNRLRSLFDQILSVFLKEVSVNKDVIMPFPPKLGDGVEADLFTLFMVVRKIGDYESVSRNELWEIVAEECGLDVGNVASLKLIYVKYLKELDQCLSQGQLKDKNLENGEIGVLEKLDSFYRELEKHQCCLPSGEWKACNDDEVAGLEDDKKAKCVGTDDGSMIGQKTNEKLSGEDDKIELSFENVVEKVDVSRINDGDDDDDDDDDESCNIEVDKIMNVVNEVPSSHSENGTTLSANDNDGLDVISQSDSISDTVIFAKSIVEKVVRSQKRKRDESLSFSGMLDWVVEAAMDPHDMAIGTLPKSSKWKKFKCDVVWKQALLAREALFAKRNVDLGNEAYGSQKKKQRTHPSMYVDDKVPIHLSSKSIRCSQRITSLKSCSCPGCISRSSSRNKRHKPEVKKTPQDQIPMPIEVQDDVGEKPKTPKTPRRGIATVPEWTGVVLVSDPKWLGTRMWAPLEDDNDRKHETDLGAIGKGRECSCECLVPGSADCVRFHITETRMKVKLALGPLFYKWKFNCMGEEASLSWSLEEEIEFKSLVIKSRQELTNESKSRHDIMDNFWKRASEALPDKTKENLVSYYFNVFVLRRRSYQNRVMPEDIDSDDDEQEVGFVGDRFGYEKIHAFPVKCSQNMQCIDLES